MTVRPSGLLELPVRDQVFAVALERLRAVVEAPRLTRVPEAPSAVVGVLNLRGEVVPVLDAAAALGLTAQGEAEFAVVLDSDRGPVGLALASEPRSAPAGVHDPAGLLDPDALAAAAESR